MDELPHTPFAITLFSDDLAASKAFYTDVFGLPVLFEDDASVAFRFDHLIVNLLAVSEAHSLVDPSPVATSDLGARSQITLDVPDVDAVCVEIERRGATLLNGPIDRPWGPRTACVKDPSGHIWEFAQRSSADA